MYVKLSSDSTCATSGGPVTNGPATVSGLTTGSPDGITWTLRTTVNNGWRGVTDGDPTKPLFVAVAISGDGNRVMTSP